MSETRGVRQAAVTSEKDDQMSETMINYRNLPNLHIFKHLLFYYGHH